MADTATVTTSIDIKEQATIALAKWIENNPGKLLQLLMLQLGEQCVAGHVGELHVSVDATIKEKRYQITSTVKIKEIDL